MSLPEYDYASFEESLQSALENKTAMPARDFSKAL